MAGWLLWLICWMLIPHAFSAIGKRCGEKLKGFRGYFSTPNYPEPYPNNMRCKWNITVDNGYQIQLNFTEFEVESTENCEDDYVKVINSNGGTIGKFCGRRDKNEYGVTVPPFDPLLVGDNSIEVEMKTDHVNDVEVPRGFEAHFAAIDVDECKHKNGGCMHYCHNFIGSFYCSCRMGYLLGKDNKSCIVQCQDVRVKQHSGTITSPEYPAEYPPNASCDWHIIADTGYHVVIEFTDFMLEEHDMSVCPYDELKIEDAEIKIGPFCGKTGPSTFRSKSNWLIVEFSSDDTQGFKGFKANYWFEPIKCPHISPPDFGYISGAKNFSYPETITYTCEPGYEYVGGNPSRKCGPDGEWTGSDSGICKRFVCPDPTSNNEHVVIHSSHGSKHYYNETVKVSCPYFYDHIGSREMRCMADKTWSGENTKCLKTCGKTIRKYEALEKCTNGRFRAKSYRLFQPWLVAIKEHGKLICAGVLISKDWVLTAAHCIKDANERNGKKGNLQIILGAFHWDRMEEGTVVRTIKRAVIRKSFDNGFHSDVTLLQLSSPVENMDKHIEPICLPNNKEHRHMFKQEHNVATIGWYEDGKNTYMTDRCVKIVHKKTCETNMSLKSFPTEIICTNATRGVNDLCSIHPGSPLVSFDQKQRKWYLGGIYTWGSLNHKNCKKSMTSFDMFTKINKHVKWIRHETRLNLKYPDVKKVKMR